MTTQQSKILSQFEKYKGYSSNIFNGEDWLEFDAFKAGAEFALIIAAEKAKIKRNYYPNNQQLESQIERDQFCVDEYNYFISEESILNCLKG